MMLRPVAQDQTLPISVADANTALRIRNTFENAVLERKLWAAVEYLEWRTGRLFRQTTLEASFLDWPTGCEEVLNIPAAPVRDVTAIEYRDAAGAWQEVTDPSSWDWRRTDTGAEVFFFSGFTPPGLTSQYAERVRVTVEAGYYARGEVETGADPEVIMPARLEEAILSLTGHWFANREAVTTGERAAVPLSLKTVVDSLTIYR